MKYMIHLGVNIDTDGTIDEVDFPSIEEIIHNKTGSGDDTGDDVELGEGQDALKAAEDVRPDAETEVKGNEVRRQGHADAVRRRQFDADGLSVRHEGPIAEADEDTGQEELPRRSCNTQQEEADGQTDVARIEDVIFSLTVEDDARQRTGQGYDDGIDDEEEGPGFHQVDFPGIGGQEGQDAGISKAHEKTDDGDDHNPVFDVVVEGHGFHLGDLFGRQFNFIDMKDDAADHAQADQDGAEGNDEGKVGDDDKEHAQEGADSGCQAGTEAVVVDALASFFRRDTGGDDGVGRRRYDAVGHAV